MSWLALPVVAAGSAALGAWWRGRRDRAALARLEQVRKDFVANVSHELRTPLAAIKAFAETLRTGGLAKKELDEFLGEIEGNADRMSRLVDDLLELSAIEAGRRPPKLERVALGKLAAEVAASLKPLASRKKLVLRLEPFHDLPDVMADRGQIKQVLTNLLDNAIKFTPEDGTVFLAPALQAGRVVVRVKDTGPGVPAADLPRLYERFYRVDKARSRELGGTGLGLAIVKHIVEAHGGSVGVESQEGAGATFSFSLPSA